MDWKQAREAMERGEHVYRDAWAGPALVEMLNGELLIVRQFGSRAEPWTPGPRALEATDWRVG